MGELGREKVSYGESHRERKGRRKGVLWGVQIEKRCAKCVHCFLFKKSQHP